MLALAQLTNTAAASRFMAYHGAMVVNQPIENSGHDHGYAARHAAFNSGSDRIGFDG